MKMKRDGRKVKALRTPRSAAIAGMVFAVFLATSIILIRLSIARNPADAAVWLAQGGRRTLALVAINLIPFAGIAFLWFMGVIRDRMGEREDKFFATIFLGSGLLFVALLFVSAAVAIGLIAMLKAAPLETAQSQIWTLGYHTTFALLNIFAIRMAAVFMLSTSTIALRASFINRWLSYLGIVIALILLVASDVVAYINLLMPLWVFLVSADVLIRSRRERREPAESTG
ncbi:MAG TPA: hypothetical protein VIK22_12345 [Candidatus Anoxymicrobiaceae bacterium]